MTCSISNKLMHALNTRLIIFIAFNYENRLCLQALNGMFIMLFCPAAGIELSVYYRVFVN